MDKLRRLAPHACAFALPVAFLLCLWAWEGFAPWGDKSLLIMDLSDQYVEFFNALRYGDVFFSWSKSLGTGYIGVFMYYVSSPFSVLALLASDGAMPLAVMAMVALKAGLCALTCSLYLQRRFGGGWRSPIFACAYALSGYVMAYSLCVMWLDAVLWLPVLLLGVEALVERKRAGLFLAALLVSLLSNYYITYMTALYACLYFLLRCVEQRLSPRAVGERLLRLAGAGILAAGLGAALLLSAFCSLLEGKFAGAQVGYAGAFACSLPRLLSKVFLGGYDSLTNEGSPYLYCSLAVLVCAGAFFLSRRAPARAKLCHGALLLILFCSMWLSPLDRVWHLFQYPNWFPCRYAFLFSFTCIAAGYRFFAGLTFRRRAVERGAAWGLLALTVAGLWGNALAVVRGLDGEFGYESLSAYARFRADKTDLLAETAGDGDFFRVGSYIDRSKNDALGFGYGGLTHYSSSYSRSVNGWAARNGLAQRYFWSAYYGSTPVTDLFLGVKYVLAGSPPGPGYIQLRENELGGIYAAPAYRPPAFFVSDLPAPADGGGPFRRQNGLFALLTGVEDVFRPAACTWEETGTGAAARVRSDGSPLYGYFPAGCGAVSLWIDGTFVTHLSDGETARVHYLGTFPAGETVLLEVEGLTGPGCQLAGLDMARFERGVGALGAAELDEVRAGGALSCTLGCPRDGYAAFSVPAGPGWRAWVDGTETQWEVLDGTFLAVPVSAGTHRVELRYTAPGLRPGLCISAASAAVLAALILRRWARPRKPRPRG